MSYHSDNKNNSDKSKFTKNDIINYYIKKKTRKETTIYTNGFKTCFSTIKVYTNHIKYMFTDLASRKLQLSHNAFIKPLSIHGSYFCIVAKYIKFFLSNYF